MVSLAVVLLGIINIIKSKNDGNQAIYWSAYMVGAEVLYRMSGGTFLYELPKYSILLFLGLGLYIEKKRHHVSVSYFIIILLLLIGIAFMDIPFNESIRKAIAFNLSGPILLCVSAVYFYKREMSISKILDVLFYMLLPIISMAVLLYFKTPDFEKIRFSSNANFATSGGYGPNQVATILGLGGFIVAVHLFFKKRITSLYLLDLFLLLYIVYRTLITFSRGGMITVIVALIAFTFFYILARKDTITQLVKYVSLIFLFGIALVVYTADLTGGMIINRYTNKNAAGIEKKDFSTGRIDLFKSELENFYEHPFFGIGVGGSKYDRLEETGVLAASHNEVSRLFSEHGMIGLIVLILLLLIPGHHILNQPYLARAFLSAFLIFWFLTINHSAMRIAFPAFIYGLSVAVISFKSKEKLND
ncbi:O-antigen ligase family protein [uncultured Lutibacter sp.]|uniref:O-antigen ligase family protein n=1 Tax=uncultured Lutibacter sp. TaxID=437739 RepID=UPI002620E7BB|nr:O-antigen ligase family protein [uncultured Lutibacter sp.]